MAIYTCIEITKGFNTEKPSLIIPQCIHIINPTVFEHHPALHTYCYMYS